MRLDKEALFAQLGYVPHPAQWDVHRSKAPRRVLACGCRFGKSLAAAAEGIAAAMQPRPRSMGWVVAPTMELADKVYREVVLLAAAHLRHRIVTIREHEKRLVLRNLGGGLSEIRGKTADNPVGLLGEGLDWVIVDEFAQLKPTIWQNYLSQRLIDRKGWALLISTPKGKGLFYDLFRRGQGEDPDYASWNHPSWVNPHLDRELIEKERERIPERVFRQEFGGEFIEGAGAVFRYIREAATGAFQGPEKDMTYYAGLDLGRLADYTVLVLVNQKREVVFVDRFHKIDWAQQIARIQATCKRYNDCWVWCDVTGNGDPIYEALLREGVNAEAYPFTVRSKAQLIDNLAMILEHRKLTLPRPEVWPEGIDELEAYEYSVTDHGTLRSSAPGGQHDDCVMGLALAAWGVGFEDPRGDHCTEGRQSLRAGNLRRRISNDTPNRGLSVHSEDCGKGRCRVVARSHPSDAFPRLPRARSGLCQESWAGGQEACNSPGEMRRRGAAGGRGPSRPGCGRSTACATTRPSRAS